MTPRDGFPDLQAILDEIQRSKPFASIDEINRHLAARTNSYNATPQRELGGLSPDQMAQLLYGDWAESGAVRLDQTVTLAECSDAALFADARTLLDFVATADLAAWMGGRARVSEFFAGKRRLSIAQIKTLRDELGIPADLLIS
ncbi:MAG TPA: hypothetical protein VGM67_18480 [Gemmatimonadaceae bacterium]|jgi:hypothetical protein